MDMFLLRGAIIVWIKTCRWSGIPPTLIMLRFEMQKETNFKTQRLIPHTPTQKAQKRLKHTWAQTRTHNTPIKQFFQLKTNIV